MNRPDSPTMAILITAAGFAGFAVWLGANPSALPEALGIDDRTPQMVTPRQMVTGGFVCGRVR